MKKISENNQNKTLEHTKWLLSKLQLIADSLTGISFGTFDYESRMEIIASVLINQGKISLSKAVTREMLRDILWDFKREKNDQPDWKQLHQKILSSISKYEEISEKEYIILFPLFINSNSEVKSIRVTETNFKFSNWEKIKKFQGWKDFVRNFELVDGKNKEEIEIILVTKFIPLVVKIKAKSPWSAFRKGNYDFEILRSLINLMDEYGVFHSKFFSSSTLNPLGKCLLPEVYGIFDGEEKFEHIAYNHESYNYQSIKAPEGTRVLPHVIKWLLDIKKLKKELKDIVLSALIRYGQAMNTTDWSVSFLALWQILELLSLRGIIETNITMAEVSKRIMKLVSNETIWNDILEITTESRHSLVHKGELSEEGFRDVNFIKLFSENAIGNFISLSSKFSSIVEMSTYYESSTKNTHDLLTQKNNVASQQNAIAKLLKDRSEK